LGDFVLLKKLGEGGMGVVYKAHQISMDRDVALKVLPKYRAKDPKFIERFYAEARASARLDHPHIVRGFAAGEAEGFHYFAMEFVAGESCETLLETHGRFEVADAVRIALDVASALQHAHSLQMLHRDIKPANILITTAGQVKLVDLGLVKALDQPGSMTQSGAGFGTPYYMPPEQARSAKSVDARSDLYALGATLYHFLTGKTPFGGETIVDVMSAKEAGQHTPARKVNPDVPEILDVVLDKLLAPEPRVRFQTASDLVSALQRTGLAAGRLSGLAGAKGGSAARPGAAAAPKPSSPRATTPAVPSAKPPATAEPDTWLVQFKDRRGQTIKRRADAQQIRELIRRGAIGTDAQAARGDAQAPMKPLVGYVEFFDLLQSRMLKERSDRAVGGGMAEQFAQIDRQEHRRRKWRKIRSALTRGLTWLILFAIAGAACWAAYLWYQGRLP
jgi:serine/threonine-protein kinase